MKPNSASRRGTATLTLRTHQTVALAALLLATGVTAFSLFVGTSDIENSLKISYSIGISESGKDLTGGPREVGTFSKFGVPLYDGLSGTGHRLPFVASWAQSPDWPLRFFTSSITYLHIRLFLISFVAYCSIFYALAT